VVLAALVAEFKGFERFTLLHLIAIQSIPKVSIAPLVFLWAGFDLKGKIILVALICFFPVFANALAGFRSADANRVDLLRAAGGSRAHVFLEVKLPSAASQLFAGLEVAVAFALIGCVVMEFVGATRGMGFLIQDSSNTFDLPLTFAAVISLGLVGVLANALVRLARGRLLFWEQDRKAKA
jgi:NitT/TauT family transport system permease protein